MSQPNPPLLPSLAFSQEHGVVLNGGSLSMGFITPKKEKEAHFFYCGRSQSSINEQLNYDSYSPSAVGIMVGPKEDIEQWLREYGPASSCLWVEAKEFSQNIDKQVISQLKLIYRLRSERSFNFLPVLNGTIVEISPPTRSCQDTRGLWKAHGMKTNKVDMKCSSFIVPPKAQSPPNISSNSSRDLSPNIEASVGLIENEEFVGLVIPRKAFKRLVFMVSQGGIIQEFQELLRRFVVNTNYVDMDFRHLDFQQWLKHHPFAAFLEGSDILVVKRGDGLLGIQWVLLRLDFGEGLIKSTTGKDVEDLELVLGNKSNSQVFGIQVNCWGQNGVSCGDTTKETQWEKSANTLVWKIWTMLDENEDSCQCTLSKVLLDALGIKDILSIPESNSFKSLFDSQAQVECHSPIVNRVIETISIFTGSKGMSWKEQCALSHLRSNSKELKCKGLHMLLNLLIGVGSKTSPAMGGTSKGLSPRSLYSNSTKHYCGGLGGLDANCFGEAIKGVVMQEDGAQAKKEGESLHILDWLNCGFIEVLLERTLVKGGDKKGKGMEKTYALDVEMALEACLKVLELIPKEGSSQLTKLLVAWAQDTYEDLLKFNLRIKQSDKGREGRPFNCAHSVQPNTKHNTTLSLQDMIEKVLRFCRLLSLLASQSPLIGGPFAESGGLDLIFDLYFCLMKRFPTNLRFGIFSKDMGICKSLEHILPGETLKIQDKPLKVLPCILPLACINEVAQACLMDHCMSTKTKKVDFAWPSTSDWKVLYPFNNPLINSTFNTNESSDHDFPFDSPLRAQLGQTHDMDFVPKDPKGEEIYKPCHTMQIMLAPELNKDCCNSSFIASPSKNGCSSPFILNHHNTNESRVEDSTTFQNPKQTRPFVPRLPLSGLRRSTSRFGPSKVESHEATTLHTPSGESCFYHVASSTTRVSNSKFEILTIVFNAKCELLQTMIQLLSNRSQSVFTSQRKLLQKFQMEDEDYLAMQFLPDIINNFLKIVPEHISMRAKKMLFEVISLLDRGKILDDIKQTPSSAKGVMDEASFMSFKIAQGPKRLVDGLLLDIGERLRILLCHLAKMLTTSQNLKEETSSNNTKQQYVTKGDLEDHDALLESLNISSGHLLNLWVDIGLLLRALLDFIVLWPEGNSVQRVLDSCGKELECVLHLLAEFSNKSSWSLAQILTMEYFLKLLTICIKNSMLKKSSKFQTWSDIDAFFWQLLVVNDLHWNCIKNFITWVVMKSCQGCFKKLLEGYQKVLLEPLDIYYSMLGERITYKSTTKALECTLHEVDILKSVFSFLRVSIRMMKKRLKCNNHMTQSSPMLLMERLLFLLDFLMNPREGILMNIIKSPNPCMKGNITTHSEIEALNILNSTTPKWESTSGCHISNSLEHTRPVGDDNLLLNNVEESCRKCPSTPCVASCAHKFTSYLKKESLGILADIFSLKSFHDHHDGLTNLSCVNPMGQNPFLCRKYVHPFLEIIFFYFLKYYNKKMGSGESSTISPLTQRISGHSTISINSDQRFCEYIGARDGSSAHDISLPRNDKDSLFCLGCIQDDKVSSVACVTYGQVLRALAQNQTKDVNHSFQQIRVMKFLVQQIGLEYEISQLATPQEVTQIVGGITHELSLQELYDCDSQGFEATTPKVGLLFIGDRGKVVSPHNNEDIDPCKAIVEENGGHKQKIKATLFGTDSNLTISKEPMSSTLLFSKECPTSLRRDSKYSKTAANQAASQNESEILTKLNMTSKESEKNVLRSSIAGVEFHTRQFGIEVSTHIGEVSMHSTTDEIGDAQCLHEDPHDGERGEINANAILTKVKYTGRFFDLNEEVERELAQEDLSHANYCSQEVDRIAQTTEFVVLENIQEESNLQNSGSNLTTLDPTKSRIGTPNKSFGTNITLEQKPSHPIIPKLNLSKTIHKSGLANKSDTSIDFEFLPSTNSTLDSKCRPYENLKLQKELQKEVVSSNQGSKSWESSVSYETGCLQRRLYRHAGLHVLLLELFISLMLTPQETLETSYSDRYPMENRKLNAPFFLSYHLNHVSNVYLLPCLSKRMKDFKPAAFRILKLTWRALFNPLIYTNKVHIARGAASQVYTAKVKQSCTMPKGVVEELVVLKIVDVPKGPYDPCKFFDVYSEVEILEKFSGEPTICQILDYGVDMESFILVLKHYKCSLHTWRKGQKVNPSTERFSPTEIQGIGIVPKFVLERFPLYLEVYSSILQAVKKLEIENVVHYDLKCDNILLEPLDSFGLESEFWSPRWPPTNPSKPLPFRICIADFGQSKASIHLGGECTVRNRGTEYVKSPEMLKLLSCQSQRDLDFNLRTIDEGVGKAVDVWSLGCLLYELLTGEYLFYDEDWLQFFMRVTLPSEELISKEKAAKLDNYGPVVDLLKFILVRDPLQRPSLDEVIICVEQLQLKLEAQPSNAQCSGDEVPTIFQFPFQSDSHTNEGFNGQILSSKIDNVLDRSKPKGHVMEYTFPTKIPQRVHVKNSLECLRGLCCCQCGEGS